MAIIDATTWQQQTNITVSGGALTQLTALCNSVSNAIKVWLDRTIEQQVFPLFVLDAPRTRRIQLAKYCPITISTFQMWLNLQAQGDPSQFTDGFLLQPYTDYWLKPSAQDSTLNDDGIVTYTRSMPFGVGYAATQYSVSSQRIDVPGALAVSFTGGYAPGTIPPDITTAAVLAVSRLRKMMTTGLFPLSESWNGESYILPSASLTKGVLDSPEISGYLNHYRHYAGMIG